MKPGWRTTEFWVTMLGNAAMLAGAAAKVFPVPVVLAVAGGTTLAYTVARTVLKRGEQSNARAGGIADAAKSVGEAINRVFGGHVHGGSAPPPMSDLNA